MSGSKSTSGRRYAVVGAGIVGLSIGWYLRRAGHGVVMIDPNSPGTGCSAGNAGAITAAGVVPIAMPGVLGSVLKMLLDRDAPLTIPVRYWLRALPWLLRFAASANPATVARSAAALTALHRNVLPAHRAILRELDAEDLISATGQLYVYRSQAERAKDEAGLTLRRKAGVRVELLDRPGIDAIQPGLSPDYVAAAYLPEQGNSLNPLRQAQVIAEGLRRRGVEFLTLSARRLVRDGSRIVGVDCGTETIGADGVVIAAGAYSSSLLREVGLNIPLESQRGYHIDLADAGVDVRVPVIPSDRKVFISQMETGVRVAGTVEIAGLEAHPSRRRAELLLADLSRAFPQARTAWDGSFWSGHRPCLPDSLPVLGEARDIRQLWLAFGHGHLGLTGAAVTGEIIAACIDGCDPGIELSPFSPDRFARRGGRTMT